jgi:hypothetical protein
MRYEYIITGTNNNTVLKAMSFKKVCKRLKTDYPNEACQVLYVNKKGNQVRRTVFNGRVV